MISRVAVGNPAFTQQVGSNVQKKEISSAEQTQKTDKVQAIKEQILNGQYKFDLQETAKAVAKDLL